MRGTLGGKVKKLCGGALTVLGGAKNRLWGGKIDSSSANKGGGGLVEERS